MENENTMKHAKAPAEKEVSAAFQWFCATSTGGGAMLSSAIFGSFFAIFMTDTMLLPASVCSAIMFVATLWDAVNDPMMGVIADRTNTRWGRYRPYFLIAPVLLTIFSTLCWLNPNFSATGKIAWVAVFYILNGMTVTMYTMPASAIIPACVKNNETRNSIVAKAAGATAVCFTIASTFTPQVTAFFENTLHINNGYIPVMIICGLLSCISFWGLFATSKEKYLSDYSERNAFHDLKTVLKHVELSPYLIVWVFAAVGYGLMFSSSVYYIIYYIGRPDLVSLYMGIVSVGALVSMVILMPIVLRVFKSGQRALAFAAAGSVVCYTVLFFFGKSNMMVLYVLSFIATSIAAMMNALVNVLMNDAMDYIQLTEGFSANGVIASIKGFAQKCGNTLVSSGILAALAASGYVAGAIGEQPDSTMFVINFLRFGAPALSAVILLICLRFNPVEKHAAEIEEMKKRISQDTVSE